MVPIRFAAGSAESPYSGIWRLFSNGDDVYLGASKASLKAFKFSLHRSGVWVLAGIDGAGVSFENGNRRARRWSRPPLTGSGITLGLSVIVPRTSLGSRKSLSGEGDNHTVWYPAPAAGRCVDFTTYFVEAGRTVSWNVGDTVLGEFSLKSGSRVVLIARTRVMSAAFATRIEDLIRNNVVRSKDPGNDVRGCHLLISESADSLKTPLVVDFPVAFGQDRAA
jgi:hypothetical protein